MHATAVDLILVGLALLFAVNGYRQGFAVGALSFLGFFGGALLGLQFAPFLAEFSTNPTLRALMALGTVVLVAVLGQALFAWIGTRIRQSIRGNGARVLDDIGGALVSVLGVLLVAWMVAAPLASSSVPWLAKAVRNSEIVGTVDSAMPPALRGVYDRLRETVDTNGFPDVFGDLTPTRVPNVPPPDPQLANSAVVRRVHGSVVKIVSDAPSCSRRIEGSGFVYAPQHVMTNAHVVAGTTRTSVDVSGVRYAGRVVVYDPEVDLAVVYVPGLDATPLPWAPTEAPSGQSAIVLGYPLDGPYTARAARIRDAREIHGPDIYNTGAVTRQVYTIRSDVRSGNSGGPLISSSGAVYGVIFAAAADDPTTGFAVTAAQADRTAQIGADRTSGTSTGDCA